MTILHNYLNGIGKKITEEKEEKKRTVKISPLQSSIYFSNFSMNLNVAETYFRS